ncbi:MAG: hypothetical protein UT66_C0043G0008 [candidate division CPR2 bacterium GW2011_GWC1_39_9]|uniref:Uncharacterized protein n=1 Tax=candidate division CPR2 bacterium GW2011_GWC2_39_10 TaxID=1618345 RepID=A0A0G0M4L2_UNCC2|nr:MAG: hypothetical protein UT18_C0002G0042 [candidate division CPR2 bacterium GW2011_GWC2_39_10]KKR33189.1 MAG: hypothetical protein UT66_C0043G0008 [candidate division CPR2 bacterium GW2011_GWC1_39_9]
MSYMCVINKVMKYNNIFGPSIQPIILKKVNKKYLINAYRNGIIYKL